MGAIQTALKNRVMMKILGPKAEINSIVEDIT